MRDTPVKADNVGDVLPAANFNAINSELENLITTADITLDPNAGPDTNLFMISQAMASYASAAWNYEDSGSANSYVLSRVAGSTLKDVPAYYDGMAISFEVGTNNTGPSTANVTTLGVRDIAFRGVALLADQLTAGDIAICFFDETNNRFNLFTPTVSYLQNASTLESGTLPGARFNDGSHGSRGGDALHAVATTIANGFMSAEDKVILNAIGTKDTVMWVNFDGTGTPTIRDSFNVDSITDNGVGDWTVNVTTTLADANYAANVTTNGAVSDSFGGISTAAAPTTTSIRVVNNEPGVGLADTSIINVTLVQ